MLMYTFKKRVYTLIHVFERTSEKVGASTVFFDVLQKTHFSRVSNTRTVLHV